MNFVSLALHGISAISVYTDVVFIRVVTWAIASGFVVFLGIAIVLYIRLVD